jgi:sugar/nucleoside kinase (ribokinase family)
MHNTTHFASGRSLDVVCLGRFGVDFYAQQIGARLEDVTSFAKYLGGSSANTAFGCARLGLKAGLISRIGNDANGRFLVETIGKEGCDTSHVGVDPARLTAAVVLGIKDKDTFPLIFLRENCADMAISEDDIDESYIASSRALLITGTTFLPITSTASATWHSTARGATTCARSSTSTIGPCCGGSPAAATARRASFRRTASPPTSRRSCRSSTS